MKLLTPPRLSRLASLAVIIQLLAFGWLGWAYVSDSTALIAEHIAALQRHGGEPASEEVLVAIEQLEAERTRQMAKALWLGSIAALGGVGITVWLTRLRVQQTAESSQEMLQNVLDTIPARVFWKDLDGVYQGCNQRFADDTIKAGPEQVVGSTDYDLGWADEAERYRSDDRAVTSSGEAKVNYEEPQTNPGGEKIWLSTSKVPLCDDNGRTIGVLGTYEEITARKEAEENLRTTLNSIGDAVIATGVDGNVISMNPVAETLTGWLVKEAEGKPLREVFEIVDGQTRQPVENPVRKVLESEVVTDLAANTLLLARDGEEYLIADSGAPIRSAAGVVTGVVLVFRDVTEEIALQKQLHQSQKMEAIGLLAGGVAHDFNNILTGILAATELLAPYLPPVTECREYHNIILQSTERAAGLTQKLLAFARKQGPASSPLDVHAVLEDVLALLRRTVDPRVTLTTDFAARHATLIGDQSQLHSAFLNLAINAVHAMPDGGTLEVVTSAVAVTELDCASSEFELAPGDHIEIGFRDSGCGIASADLEKIFEPFFTRKELGQGTGLGLSAVYGTVQQHRGSVSVESRVEVGSVFRVLLPLTDERAERTFEPSPDALRGEGCVLVIDDEPVMRTTARAILEDLGYKVLVAENGKVGLESLRIDRDRVDVVILDMVMPVMNGRDCLAVLRQEAPDLPVIFCSGFSQGEDLREMKRLGVDHFLLKPFRRVELGEAVKTALSRRRPGLE